MDLTTKSSISEADVTDGAKRDKPELRREERNHDIRMYKELINGKFPFSDSVLVKILRVLASSDEIGDERVFLGSLAFATGIYAVYSSERLTNEVKKCWSLKEPSLSAFDENFKIRDLQWFKLVITHGYLQLNAEKIYNQETFFLAFEIFQKSCLTYTKYSYVACKLLQAWLEKTSRTNFWHNDDTNELETKLEAIIFSNWDNCINEISRRNATQIFPIYLRIMRDKYDNFVKLIFENCIQNFSWQNVTKYTILIEVCKIFDDPMIIVNSGLTSCIFTSLTRNNLRHAGTLLYLTFLQKLKTYELWENIFAEDLTRISAEWESEKELAAIEYLWEQWMKPTLRKFPKISTYLWELWGSPLSTRHLELSASYLEKISEQLRIEVPLCNKMDLNSRIVDISEILRLNAFAIICHVDDSKVSLNEPRPFEIFKRSLYFNANASTISMRKGIIENFKIFLANATKLAENNPRTDLHLRRLIEWLHEFLLDCFEIGSTYQRKIFGLNLYEIILTFTVDHVFDDSSGMPMKNEAMLKSANDFSLRMIEQNSWKFIDRKSFILIAKLVMDPMVDIRDKATSIIIRFFNNDVVTPEDKKVLLNIALECCDTLRFHEIAGSSALLKILSVWGIDKMKCLNDILETSTLRLDEMRKDILKSVSQGLPFYSLLTVILVAGLTNESTSDDSIRKVLHHLENATNFFLSALTTKDHDSEYSSSFKDMSIAIEATIKNSEIDVDDEECTLSPAYQLVVSCIWNSLKVSCELAAAIGARSETEEIVSRTANLIVSVLLKCRHKGAIEAAGLALAKLTKIHCKGKYNEMIKSHLSNLLSIDSSDNINLTRRGAGLTMMFHRIVSSDNRNNRPFVHFAMGKLMDSLNSKSSIRNEDCQRDSASVRHLYFLRSLVADKAVQAQLAQYMDDVCLLCFEYLQSPDWIVRNASSHLFGAIVPRLIGQCNARELDYGIGYSIDNFVTHYPNLAVYVLEKLENSTSSFDWRTDIRFTDMSIVNRIVPILTLLSKMSTGGCDLVDYSSRDYTLRAKNIFFILLAHPVFHIRQLAAKSYAAFVPFADIRWELSLMKGRKINWHYGNYNHGQLLAQFYLQRKYEHEIRCTSDKFVIRKHRIYEENYKSATRIQLSRAEYCWTKRFYESPDSPVRSLTIHNLSCFTISSLLLKCLIDCPIALHIRRTMKNPETYGIDEHEFVSSLFNESSDESPKLGLDEFLKNVIAFRGQSLSCPWTRQFYIKHARSARHHAIFAINSKDPNEDSQLDSLVADALDISADSSKIQILFDELSTIMNITKSRNVSNELKKRLIVLSNELKRIHEKSVRPYAKKLLIIGDTIAIDAGIMKKNSVKSMINEIFDSIYRGKFSDDSTTKYLIIDWLSRLVEKTLDDNVDSFIFDITRRERDFPTPEIINLICSVTILLTDEDTEIRESTAVKLSRFAKMIFHARENSICSRMFVHEIWNKFSASLIESSSVSIGNSTILKLIDSMEIEILKINSPYEENESFQRDNTELLNMLFYCEKIVSEGISLTGNDDDVELSRQIDGTIRAKYELQRSAGIDASDIEEYLTLDTLNYLAKKKFDLMNFLSGHISRPRQ